MFPQTLVVCDIGIDHQEVQDNIKEVLEDGDGFSISKTNLHEDERFWILTCLLYTSPSPRDGLLSRMPSSA